MPENCDSDDFDNQWTNWMQAMMTASCDTTGEECLPNCPEAIQNVTSSHGCMVNVIKV